MRRTFKAKSAFLSSKIFFLLFWKYTISQLILYTHHYLAERRRREDFINEINQQVPVAMTMPSMTTVVLDHGKYPRASPQVVSDAMTNIRPRGQVHQYGVSKAGKGIRNQTGETSPFRSYILSQSLLDSDPSTWGDLSTFENGNGPSKGQGTTKLTSPGTRGEWLDLFKFITF